MIQTRAQKIRVLIVEDSAVIRLLLERIINSDPRLEVAGAVANGREAILALDKLSPDIVSMDIRMPVMDGFETTRKIMETRPTPIVVVSASVDKSDLKISMNALKAGALSVVEKPVGLTHRDYETLSRRLCQQLVVMSDVKLVRRRFSSRAASTEHIHAPDEKRLSPARPFPHDRYDIVGLVASTGGPNALVQVLGGLGANFPLPIVIVQHMTPTFLAGFVSWLNDSVALPVQIAVDGSSLAAGCAYVAPADVHMHVNGFTLRLASGEEVSGQRPSGTVMLRSIADSLGSKAIGVVLTGMGDDGARGLHALSRAGGYTIAEDETTAVVYGMPAVAVRMGGVHETLPLPRIAPRLVELAKMTERAGV